MYCIPWQGKKTVVGGLVQEITAFPLQPVEPNFTRGPLGPLRLKSLPSNLSARILPPLQQIGWEEGLLTPSSTFESSVVPLALYRTQPIRPCYL